MRNNGKFRGKYRNESARKPSWYYTQPGAYFITICTHDRAPWFGFVQSGIMCVSDIGSIVHQCWANIPHHFPHVSLDAFIVMPDHMHGIIIIDKRPRVIVGTYDSYVPTPAGGKNDHRRTKPVTESIPFIPQRPPSGSVGTIIGQFKSVCTKRMWETGHPDFAWQTRFHDRIIRNDAALERIRRYIIDNPTNWHSL